MASSIDPDKITAVQAVLDRVSSWQDGATEGTLEDEVRKGLDEVGVSLEESQIDALVAALEADKGEADASEVLG